MLTSNPFARALQLLALLPVISAATITLSIPPQTNLLNPNTLPASTHATLNSLGVSYSAPLTTQNTFVFRNVTPGSYLGDVHSGTYGFAPLRVDLLPEGETVKVWETFRGNDWENKGEEVTKISGAFPVKALGAKVPFTERGSFSIMSILKNPMILMGLVSLVLFVVMPKMVDNMDPETRAEFEEQAQKNPMNSIMSGGNPGAGSNFDMAGFLAGQSSSSKDEAAEPGSGNGGKKGGRK